VASALVGAAVLGIGCDADQGGDLAAVELAQLGQFGQQHRGGGAADAGHLAEALVLLLEGRVVLQQPGDGLFDLLALPAQQAQALGDQPAQQGLLVAEGLVADGLDFLDQVGACAAELAQLFLLGGGRRGGPGLEGLAEAAEQLGVDGVGFGQQTCGLGELADPCGLDDRDGDGCGVEGAQDGLFVASGGLADDLQGLACGLKEPDQPAQACGAVGQGVETTLQVQQQGILCNVEADVGNVGGVHCDSFL